MARSLGHISLCSNNPSWTPVCSTAALPKTAGTHVPRCSTYLQPACIRRTALPRARHSQAAYIGLAPLEHAIHCHTNSADTARFYCMLSCPARGSHHLQQPRNWFTSGSPVFTQLCNTNQSLLTGRAYHSKVHKVRRGHCTPMQRFPVQKGRYCAHAAVRRRPERLENIVGARRRRAPQRVWVRIVVSPAIPGCRVSVRRATRMHVHVRVARSVPQDALAAVGACLPIVHVRLTRQAVPRTLRSAPGCSPA